MAKKTKTASIVRYSQPAGPRSIVVNVPRPRAMSVPHHKPKRHHRRNGGGGGDTIIHHMVAGGLLGYIDANGINVPTLPMLGRAGTLALACHFFAGKGGQWGGWLRAASKTFAGIATYEQVRDGAIKGDVGEYFDNIAPQT